MVKAIHVEGIAEFKQEADKHKDKTVFALFSGSKDANGENWCPDCVAADPVIERNLKHVPDGAVFIHCGVGDRTYWKDKDNDFRKDPLLKLRCVPTLLCLGKPQRLEEEQCAKDNLVEMLFTGDD